MLVNTDSHTILNIQPFGAGLSRTLILVIMLLLLMWYTDIDIYLSYITVINVILGGAVMTD